jgi:tetratricopeptide (TPR) repeat protein/transcriptional regulator with XRE-family HTH domain
VAGHVAGFGEQVRRHRVAAHLTQEELAERTGLSVRAISDIERGRTVRPHDSSVSVLASTLGLEPPDELATPAGPEEGQRSVPRQLPTSLPFFAGRAAELETLNGLLRRRTGAHGTVVTAVISGTAGIGKTALALHWAHRSAGSFPDGQLYASLRGFDPSAEPVPPVAAIRGFLDALDVAPDQVPVSAEAQASLYRSLLADRRMLIVVDNARDAEQVAPLLPASPACLVLVTSRNQMPDLVATQGAYPLPLDLLDTGDAAQLLALRLGPQRLADEAGAVHQLIELCARLPLALSIIAARAATHPHFPLASMVAELRDSRTRLDALDSGERASSLRAVFSCSYEKLSAPAARVFRLLGAHPGPDVTVAATASMAGISVREARKALAELHRGNLLTEPLPGRFAFHDLLRAYAAELVSAPGSEPERAAAARRMLDHYLHTARAAAIILYPHREAVTVAEPGPGVLPEDVADYDQAMRWLEAEHKVLLATIAQAAETGQDSHALQLSVILPTFLDGRGYWDSLVTVQQTALAVAQRLGDRQAQAQVQRALGQAYTRIGRNADARTCFMHALDLHRQLGDRLGEGRVELALAYMSEHQDHYAPALTHCKQALALFRAAGDRSWQAFALNSVGWCYARVGDYEQALAYCEQAMTLHRELGNADGEASTWDSLGFAHQQLGHHAEAVACYQRAKPVFVQRGDRFYLTEVLVHLGDSHQAAGDLEAARDAWLEALAILDELRHHNADQVRAKLEGLGSRPGTTPGEGAANKGQASGRAVGGIGVGSSESPDR